MCSRQGGENHRKSDVSPDTSTRAALDARMRPLAGITAHEGGSLVREVPIHRPRGGPLRPSCAAFFAPISMKPDDSRVSGLILGSHNRRTSRASK